MSTLLTAIQVRRDGFGPLAPPSASPEGTSGNKPRPGLGPAPEESAGLAEQRGRRGGAAPRRPRGAAELSERATSRFSTSRRATGPDRLMIVLVARQRVPSGSRPRAGGRRGSGRPLTPRGRRCHPRQGATSYGRCQSSPAAERARRSVRLQARGRRAGSRRAGVTGACSPSLPPLRRRLTFTDGGAERPRC
jgi:hypothetical protein